METVDYGSAIRQAFEYLLEKYPEVFVMGQGLWSPWYVGNTMTNLEKRFGKDRVIDTPVSESACTGAAVGASLAGMKPIVVHPRMDFMLYAMDAIVNQAAKWSHMTGGMANPSVTIRSIINRGGEQGAQHSQSLHSWFANIPGLRVVMPSSVSDARDLLIASVLCRDPVVYIDDRWLYEQTDMIGEISELDLSTIAPRVVKSGSDVTLVGSGFSTKLCLDVSVALAADGIDSEVIDMRVINPIQPDAITNSYNKTGRLVVVDGGWSSCGLSAEIIALGTEAVDPANIKCRPQRITLPPSPAPCSKKLEALYYPNANSVANSVREMFV